MNKKEIKQAYKERDVIGGIYGIRCNANQKVLVLATQNLLAQKNKFQFFLTTSQTIDQVELSDDVKLYGLSRFEFLVYEEVTKQPEQTTNEFKSDLDALKDIYIEQIGKENIYNR